MATKQVSALFLILFFIVQTIPVLFIAPPLESTPVREAPLSMSSTTNADSATLFLHSRTSALQMGNQSTIQILNHQVGVNDDSINATQSIDISAFLDPALATATTLNGQVTFALWIRGSGGPNSKATVSFTLNRADANGTIFGSAIATVSTGNVIFPTTYTEHTATTSVSNVQLAAGERLKLSVQISGNNGITYTARWGSNLYQSHIVLPITVPIGVTANDFTDANGQSIDTYWVGTTTTNTVLSLTLSSPLTMNHVENVSVEFVAPNGSVFSSTSLSTSSSSWQAQGVWNLTLPLNANSIAGDWVVRYQIDSLDAARWLADHPGDGTAGGYRVFTNITIPVRYSGVLDVNCNNAEGDSLADVEIQVTVSGQRRADLDETCNISGYAQMNLPLSNIKLEFRYQDTGVYSTTFSLTANQSLSVNTQVSDIHLNATHADGRAAGMLHVWVVHPNGTLMLAGYAFNSTTTLSDLPMGQYTISSSWMGNPLPSAIATHFGQSGGTEVTINTTVTPTYVQVTDQVGSPIEGVQLIARDVNTQTIRGAATTLANGLAAFDLMTDEYVLEPVWQRFSFPSQTVEFTGDQVNISLELQHVNFSIIDVNGMPLPFANIRILDENGQTIILGDTNFTGQGDIRLPNGSYPVAVQWSSRYFLMGDMIVSPNANWVLTLPIGMFEFTLVTPEGDAIDGAIVSLRDTLNIQWSGLVTNVTGQTNIRAPEGDVQAKVELDGFIIHNQSLVLDFNASSITLTIDLPDIFVVVRTVDGQVLDAVELQVRTFGDAILDVGVTNSNGTATLRAPEGAHLLTARWLGIEIGSMNVTVEGATFVNFTASAFMVTFNALDRSNQPVDNVTLLIRKASSSVILATAQTDTSGRVSILLPSGDYSIQGSWFGIEVLNSNFTISTTVTIDISVEVILVEINVVDVDGEPLYGARVDLLRNGVFSSTATVNPNGRALFRVAAGDYTAVVTWFSIEVNQTELTFQADDLSIPTLVGEVVSVYVEVVDRDGIPVDGVTVTIREGFIILDQNISANGGDLRLRLPYGQYQARATLSGILVAEIEEFSSPGNGLVRIEIALERIQLSIVDLDNMPLDEIQVFAHDARTFGVMVTESDENGVASLRLPEGEYELDFSWQGRIIASQNLSVPNQNNLTYQLQLREHTIFVRDADGRIAKGVTVTLRDANDRVLSTEIVDASGSISTLVGAGLHRVSISWAGLGLYSENYIPLASSSYEIDLPIGVVELQVVDLDDRPLSQLGIIIRLDSGRLLDVVNTNETGSASLYLPESTIIITLQLQGYVIGETEVELVGQPFVELTAPVRTRTFTLHDTVNQPVRGAELYLITSSGLYIGPALSDGNGDFTVLLLPGELWLEGQWNGRVVVNQNLTDNQASDILSAGIHLVEFSFVSPLDESEQMVRNIVMRDAVSGWTYTVPPSQTLQLPSGNHSMSLIWEDVQLPDIHLTISSSGQEEVSLPLSVKEIEFMRVDKSGLNTEVLVRLSQGVWSSMFSSSGVSTFVMPPGTVNMEVFFDDVLVKDVVLREELHDVLLPIDTFTLVIERTDGSTIATDRLEVSWPGSPWMLMTDAGVTGPTNVEWDARITYNGWFFERGMAIPNEGQVAKIYVEISTVSVKVVDRNGDFITDSSCTFSGEDASATVVTGNEAVSIELLVGNYDYLCRIPSAGEVGEDGRRSSKEYSGVLIVNEDVNNELKIEVVELPFSETAQVKGILASGVGLALGAAALLGWAVALVSLNKLMSRKNKDAQAPSVSLASSTQGTISRQGYDVDDLFNER